MDKDKVIALLNEDLEGEHGAIIQYLTHAYAMGEGEMSCELEAIAREEMRHLDWLAEKLVDINGSPSIEHTEVDRSPRTADMLRADIDIEQKVAREYDRVAGETEDPGLKDLLLRIRDQELYHAEVFGDLLKEEEGKPL